MVKTVFQSFPNSVFICLCISLESCFKDGPTISKNDQISVDQNVILRNGTEIHDCDYEPFGCVVTNKTKNLITSNGCEVTVHYKFFDCTTTGEGIFIRDITYDFDESNYFCQQVLQYWKSLMDNGNFTLLQSNMIAYHRALVEQIELVEIAHLNKNFYGCHAGSFQFSILANTCVAICPITQGEFYSFEEVYCGEGCCERIRHFCFNAQGELELDDPQVGFIKPCTFNGPIGCSNSILGCQAQGCDRVI